MARLDLRMFSSNPPHDGANTFVGVIFAVVGLYFSAVPAVELARAPWDLATTGVEIEGTRGEQRRLRGDQYYIEVDGQTHVCHRGQQKFPGESATILYDPADPSRCRARDSIGGPSRYEIANLCFGLVFLLMGSAVLMARYAEPRPEWQRENPGPLLRPWAMTVARALSICSMISTAVVVWVLLFALDLPSNAWAPERAASPKVEEAPEVAKPVATPTTTTIEPVALEIVEGADWPLAKPTLRKIDVRGPSVWIGDPEGVGSRLVVSTGKSYFSRGDQHRLVDVAAGRVLATFDDEGIVSASAKVVVTRKGDAAVIVHTDDGLVVAPQISLPDGGAPTKVRIVASETDDRVWLFAQASDGTVYHGQWMDPRTPAQALRDTMPDATKLWPRFATGANGIEVWNTELDVGPTGCSRLRFDVGATPRCLQRGAGDGFFGLPFSPFLAGPWQVVGVTEVALVNADTGAKQMLLPECAGLEVTRLDSPPRLLAVCSDETQTRRIYALWSPEVTRTFVLEQRSSSINSGVRREPVVAMEEIADSEPLVHWLDMESGKLFASPPVRALVYGGSFGYARRILAQRVGEPNALWMMDLEAGTIERITRDIGCTESLIQTDLIGTRAVIGCSGDGAMAGDGARLRAFRWTEVIDFAARKRWRTDGAFDGRIAPDGTVVGVTRKRPAGVVGIDLK